MSQYRSGAVNIPNPPTDVITGVNTQWSSAGIKEGDLFSLTGSMEVYEVSSVESDTQLTLKTTPQGQAAGNNQRYSITRDFTPNNHLPYMTPGDDVAGILAHLIRRLDGLLNAPQASGWTVQGGIGPNLLSSPINLSGVLSAGGFRLSVADIGLRLENGRHYVVTVSPALHSSEGGPESRNINMVGGFGEMTIGFGGNAPVPYISIEFRNGADGTGTGNTSAYITGTGLPADYMNIVGIYEFAEAGPPGASSYVHIAYAFDDRGTDFSLTPNEATRFIGFATTTSRNRPASWQDYTWALFFAGTDGATLPPIHPVVPTTDKILWPDGDEMLWPNTDESDAILWG